MLRARLGIRIPHLSQGDGTGGNTRLAGSPLEYIS